VGTIEDPDEGCGPNYIRALGFAKMKSYIWIYAFINLAPQKKDFWLSFVNELNTITKIYVYKNYSSVQFYAKSFIKS